MKTSALLCVLLVTRLNGELFSSMAGLEAISLSSTLLTDILSEYIEAEERRIEQLRDYVYVNLFMHPFSYSSTPFQHCAT